MIKKYGLLDSLVFILFFLLPCISGCQGGRDSTISSFSENSKFGIIADETIDKNSNTANNSTAEEITQEHVSSLQNKIATIHNPEPASILLFGTGIMVFSFYKNREKKQQ